MNDLAESYKDINSRENAKREYNSLIHDTALPFCDFYSKFKLLKEELAYNNHYLINDLQGKLSTRLLKDFTTVSDLNRGFTTL